MNLDDGWITCPEVLKMMFDARAFQPGDMVRLAPHAHMDHSWVGVVIELKRRLELQGVHGDEIVWEFISISSPPSEHSTYTMKRLNFDAWRRPLTPTHKEAK